VSQKIRTASRLNQKRLAPPAFVEQLEERTLFSLYTPLAGINDVVFDPSRNVVYATTDSGMIQRYNVATDQLLTPWNVGGKLLGADISTDNSFLYVADAANPRVLKVKLSDGSVTPITYTPSGIEGNAYDVAVVGARVFFTTQFNGSGWTPLREISVATNVVTTRSDLSSVRQNSVLSRAANGSSLFLSESNISSGPIHYYSTSSNSFTGSGQTQTSLSGVQHDVSRDGKLVAMRFGSGVSLFDPSLGGVGTIAGADGGLRFDVLRDVLYTINSSTDQIIGYDSVTQQKRFTVPLDWNIGTGSNFGSGMMAIAPGRAIISDDNGLLVVDVPQPSGVAAQFELSGTSAFAKAGVAQKVRIRALDWAGYQIPSFRGTVTFYSSDPAAVLPAPYTFTAADNGVAEVSFTLNTPGTQSLTLNSPGITAATVGNLRVHAAGANVIPVTDSRENVFDAKRNRLYLSTSRGVIERYDLATETMLEPLAVGVNLYGIDISADGRWLVVQEGSSSGTNGQYIKVDLNLLDTAGTQSNYITRISYANYSLERGGWDIARTVRGTFVADGQFAGSGWVPLRDINVSTNTAADLVGSSTVRQNTGIGRSPDGRYLLLTEYNISSGPVTIFDTQTNTKVASLDTGVFLPGESGSVNRDGTLFALEVSGAIRIYDRALQLVTTLTGIDGGGAFDPAANVYYGINASTNQINIYRTTDWAVTSTVNVGEDVGGSVPMGVGLVNLGLNSAQLFLTTPSGVRVFAMTPPVPPAPTGPVVTGLSLYNADTDTLITQLTDGMTIDLATLSSRNVNVLAGTSPYPTGSVRFGWDAAPGAFNSAFETQVSAPYSLFKDDNGNLRPGTFKVGSHTLTATAFTGTNASGTAGATVTIHFNVIDTSPAAPAAPTTLTAAASGNSITLKWVDKASNEAGFEIQRATNSTFTSGLTSFKIATPNLATYVDNGLASGTTYYYRVRAYAGNTNSGFTNTANAKTAVAAPVVTKLVLINADTDTAVLDLVDGMTISKAAFASLKNFSVQAVVSGTVGSVKFGYQGNASARIEGTAPWSLFGDGGTGNYVGKAFALGSYTVSATPYTAANATGTVGAIVTIHFTVVA